MLQNITLPQTGVGLTSFPCSSRADATVFDSHLTLSRYGKVVTIGCYGTVANMSTKLNVVSAAVPRVVARLYPNGTVDTTQALNGTEYRGAPICASSRPLRLRLLRLP